MIERKIDKKQIMKWINVVFASLLVLFIGIGFWIGSNLHSLFLGPQDITDLHDDIIQKEAANKDLKHAYMKLDVDKITGSYAAYGKSIDSKMDNDQVYYLMPLENGTYFITIIANDDYIPKLDEMEQAFYRSIGNEEKTYSEPISLEGGFMKLNDQEKTLALEYFTTYDETIQEIDQLPQYLSPYAFVIDEVGGMSISSIWSLWYVEIGLLVILLLCIVWYIYMFMKHQIEMKQVDTTEEVEK